MRQLHEMKQSTLAMSTLYLGALGIVGGGAMAVAEKQYLWLVLAVVGLVSFLYGTSVRQKDLRLAYRAYLKDVELEDLRTAKSKGAVDEKSLGLVDEEIRRRRKAQLP